MEFDTRIVYLCLKCFRIEKFCFWIIISLCCSFSLMWVSNVSKVSFKNPIYSKNKLWLCWKVYDVNTKSSVVVQLWMSIDVTEPFISVTLYELVPCVSMYNFENVIFDFFISFHLFRSGRFMLLNAFILFSFSIFD